MTLGAVLEPLIVVSLLAGGVLVNRDRTWDLTPSSGGPAAPWRALKTRVRRWKATGSFSPTHEERVGGSLEIGRGQLPGDGDVMGLGSWSWAKDRDGSLLQQDGSNIPRWRERKLRLLKWEMPVATPNTEVFKNRMLSRLLRRYPFLVEAWYWALIYWVYQLGRAFTALTLSSSTVDTARTHALQVVHVEQALGLFVEPAVQAWFLGHPTILHWTNRIYSFIHIPGTITFLVVLYYVTTTRPRNRRLAAMVRNSRRPPSSSGSGAAHHPRSSTSSTYSGSSRSPSPPSPASSTDSPPWERSAQAAAAAASSNPRLNPNVYDRARRTMAVCNLIAFTVFTLWPCMPPRLLSDPTYNGPDARESKAYGFVDTVHSKEGESSVWTTNRFCNQYAAMPSLHFGYSFLIGLTIASLPLAAGSISLSSATLPTTSPSFSPISSPSAATRLRRFLRLPRTSRLRLALFAVGMAYPLTILAAIVATANHFVLDAVAGACVCALAWRANAVLLNLLPVEDWFLWCLGMHRPEKRVGWADEVGAPGMAGAPGGEGGKMLRI